MVTRTYSMPFNMPFNMAIRNRRTRCRGLTLIEVLVVVAIIGLLVGLLMPALNGARESSRKTTCNNNLRQMGLASVSHLEQLQIFPSGGFTTAKASLLIRPANGFAELQPANWTYNLLPFIELQGMRDQSETGAGFGTISKVCPPVFRCPTTWNPETPTATNYTGNGGTPDAPPPATPSHLRYPPDKTRDLAGNLVLLHDIVTYPAGQQDILRQQTSGYPHAVSGLPYSPMGALGPITGVIAPFGRVRAAHVTDGMSSTFLVGERNNFGNCPGGKDWLLGFNWESIRFTNTPPVSTQHVAAFQNTGCVQSFGGRHVDTFGMVVCDGSVRQVAYTVDLTVFRACGSRNKREVQAGSLDQ
jgi:prepilin-type N-terminal cleavage/methylation domain-containing protein